MDHLYYAQQRKVKILVVNFGVVQVIQNVVTHKMLK